MHPEIADLASIENRTESEAAHVFDRAFDRAARGIELVLATAFVGIVLLNFANVVGRYALGSAMHWADEVEVFVMIAITVLGAVVVTWRRQHLRMDVLFNLLPRPLKTVFRLVELVLMLAICGFVAWHAADYTMRMFDIGRTSDTADIPMWIPHASVAAGFGLIVVVCLWQLLRGPKVGLSDGAVSHTTDSMEIRP